MNILILISSLSFGGAEKQAVIDANLLAKDHNVILGSFSDGPLKNQLNLNVKHILIKKDNYIFTAIRLIKIIRQNNINIINASLFASMIISGLSSVFANVPVIWHFHSHEYDIPVLSQWALKYVAKFSMVKKILFVNKELKEHFINKYKFPKGKLGILYNSSDIKKSEIKESDSSDINIGYVGRIIKLKRVNYLIDLAQYLKNKKINFLIHIIGDGEEKNKIEQYAKELNVDDQIKFWGFQNNTEKFYDIFDLFILPSREECLSIALIDAAMKGIPSVAFNVGGNSEIIINGKTGYIVNTKEEMFDKITLLIFNKDLRNNLGKAARIHAKKLFSEKAHKKELKRIYESIFA